MAREPNDNYPTPAWCTRLILEALPDLKGDHWIEPSAGAGAIVREVVQVRRVVTIHCWEIDATTAQECAAASLLENWPTIVSCADFLNVKPPADEPDRYAVVIGNPPYSLAEKFVRHSRSVAPRATIVLLLRLGFLASAERLQLWRDVGSPDVYVLPQRPGFTGNGKTDMSDYAWYVWPPMRRDFGLVRHLPLVSDEKRGVTRKRRKGTP